MIPFRVYLKGELGKLRNTNDAQDFLNANAGCSLSTFGILANVEALTSLFASQGEVDAYVDRLSDELIESLVEICDIRWRQNGVFEKLKSAAAWQEQVVPVEIIDVQRAESHLASLFERNDNQLLRICNDSELMSQLPYQDYARGNPVLHPVCLAKKIGERYRVFDGIHRAIQLVCNGETTLRLVIPADFA